MAGVAVFLNRVEQRLVLALSVRARQLLEVLFVYLVPEPFETHFYPGLKAQNAFN